MLDVQQSPELQAALLAVKQANRGIKRDINRDARRRLGPIWQQQLAAKATSLVDRRAILPGARVQVGDRRITAKAATSNRALSGGLVPSIDYGPLEWGANRKQASVEARSSKGKAYRYQRTQGGQFRPWSREGHVAMRAVGDTITEAVGIWVQTIVGYFRGAWDVR